MTKVPLAWLERADARRFVPKAPAYEAVPELRWPVVVVSVTEVIPPQRSPGVVGLHEERTLSLLRAITSGRALPALAVDRPPGQPRYRVRDGYHRYILSIALGFTHVPVSERPYFDFDAR